MTCRAGEFCIAVYHLQTHMIAPSTERFALLHTQQPVTNNTRTYTLSLKRFIFNIRLYQHSRRCKTSTGCRRTRSNSSRYCFGSRNEEGPHDRRGCATNTSTSSAATPTAGPSAGPATFPDRPTGVGSGRAEEAGPNESSGGKND